MRSLPPLFRLALVGLVTVAGVPAQQPELPKDTPAKKAPSKNLLEFKGEAKVNVHTYKMEKDAIYRITAKGDGFLAEVRIEGQFNPSGFGPPVTSTNAIAVRGKNAPAQLIFAPTETKEYRIKVDFAPGSDVGKGPHPYNLTIERAKLEAHTTAKDTEFKVSEQSTKLELGKAYAITVTGRGFEPDVQIVDAGKPKLSAFNDGKSIGFGPDAEFNTTLTFIPMKTADYRIVVAIGPYSRPRPGQLSYTTKIAELKTDLVLNEQLTMKDPKYPRRGGPHKVHTVKLQADKKYQIDMMSSVFDAYLFLEDSQGNYLMEDDDSGGNLNARMVFTPTKTDTYRVIATTFNKGQGANAGPYTLVVMENPNAVARPLFPPFKKQ